MDRPSGARRVLLIAESPAIHEDFRKILAPGRLNRARSSHPQGLEAGLVPAVRTLFELDSVHAGDAAVEFVRRAVRDRQPVAMAFLEMKMQRSGGPELLERLWAVDPDVQVVICTADSDFSWEAMLERLGHADRFVILKKPFGPLEVRQLAESLTEKWRLAQLERARFGDLERRLRERKEDQQSMRRIDGQLEQASTAGRSIDTSATSGRPSPRAALAADLRRAIEHGELSVHYQPLVEIASHRVVGLALARWDRPGVGLVSPAQFIELAEETGLILPLGELILRQVCEQLVRWREEGVATVRTAVNLSAVQLERQPVFDLIRQMLRETGLQPQQLALELTESTLVKRIDEHAQVLERLRADGVLIEVDDFGTGYSSLAYLRRLPIDVLKIDRSFISQLEQSESDEAIVAAILALARNLGLKVIAEGVETAGQLQLLGKHGCEVAQGFYFSRPLPPAECRQLLVDLASRTSFTDTLRLRHLT